MFEDLNEASVGGGGSKFQGFQERNHGGIIWKDSYASIYGSRNTLLIGIW